MGNFEYLLTKTTNDINFIDFMLIEDHKFIRSYCNCQLVPSLY